MNVLTVVKVWEGRWSFIRQNAQGSGGGSALLQKMRKKAKLPVSGRYTFCGGSSRKADGGEGTSDHRDKEKNTNINITR